MSRLFYHTMQDNAGNLLFGVTGTMRLAGTGTLATIYGDAALTIPIANPMTNHVSYGSFKCYLGPGSYDFAMAKAGYSFETLTGLPGGGSMAQQDASAVAITGGTITNMTSMASSGTLAVGGGSSLNGGVGVGTTAPATAGHLDVAAVASIGGTAPSGAITLSLLHTKASRYGIILKAAGADVGNEGIVFQNMAATFVGNINYSSTATSYNTSSDARLKHAVQTLTGELSVIRALRPVRFRWLADDSEGVGFIAGEVAEHVQGVITGEPDAMEPDGVTMKPQMIDYSKLVPWLVGALQTLAGQVETLTERVTELEAGA